MSKNNKIAMILYGTSFLSNSCSVIFFLSEKEIYGKILLIIGVFLSSMASLCEIRILKQTK